MEVTEIRFYHLQRGSAEKTVPSLLKKAVEQGHKVLFKLPNVTRRDFYDEWLWREGFLPHAREGDPEDSLHPLWLTTVDEAPNNPTMVLLAEGSDFPPLRPFQLICNVFDSLDKERLDQARLMWGKLKKEKDLVLTYWKQQDNGGWKQEEK